MTKRFVSEAIRPRGDLFAATFGNGEPPLPGRFAWRDEELVIDSVARVWRSTTMDRGDSYLARHWYALHLADGRDVVIYFDRKARRGAPNWWLYSIGDASEREENPG